MFLHPSSSTNIKDNNTRSNSVLVVVNCTYFVLSFFSLLFFLPFTLSCPCAHPLCHVTFDVPSNDTSLERHTSRASDSRRDKGGKNESEVNVTATEKRFAYSLLEKLLQYFDNASMNMTQTRPSSRFSRRESYCTATEDVKFFGKVRLH